MIDLPKKELASLLNRIANGDDKAVENLYKYYQSPLKKFIHFHINDENYVEEIANDVFMVVLKNPDKYDGTSKFTTWLCGIAINECKDSHRKQGRQPQTQEIDDEVMTTIPDDNQSILQTLEHKERDEVLRECIKRLPSNQREAISMAFLNDEKVEAIAAIQGCPIGTVKTRLTHARLKIKECFKNALGNGSSL